MEWESLEWIDVAQGWGSWRAAYGNEQSGSIKRNNLFLVTEELYFSCRNLLRVKSFSWLLALKHECSAHLFFVYLTTVVIIV